MEVFKPSNSKFYYMDFTFNGKRIKKTTKQTNQNEAMKVAAAAYAQMENDQKALVNGKSQVSMAQAFDAIIATVEGSTKKNYQWAKNKWLGLGSFGDVWHLPEGIMLHELTRQHLDDHVAARRKEGAKPNTINVEIRILRIAVNKHKGVCVEPNINGIKTIKGFVKTRYASDAEEKEILKRLSENDGLGYANAYALAVFLLDTGVRLSEALNAEWAMLNLDRAEFEVYRLKTKSHDVIPLSPRLVEILRRRHNQDKPFEHMDWSIKVLRKVLHEVCNSNATINAQKGKVTPHGLRDTFASRLVKEGMTTHELANLLGHTSAAMSQKYSHLENRDVAEKARLLMAQRHQQQSAI